MSPEDLNEREAPACPSLGPTALKAVFVRITLQAVCTAG